jgi:hypothetical protein
MLSTQLDFFVSSSGKAHVLKTFQTAKIFLLGPSKNRPDLKRIKQLRDGLIAANSYIKPLQQLPGSCVSWKLSRKCALLNGKATPFEGHAVKYLHDVCQVSYLLKTLWHEH